ncbi:hypothetical protein FI667_g9350, partial [Globisporangium splendens]
MRALSQSAGDATLDEELGLALASFMDAAEKPQSFESLKTPSTTPVTWDDTGTSSTEEEVVSDGDDMFAFAFGSERENDLELEVQRLLETESFFDPSTNAMAPIQLDAGDASEVLRDVPPNDFSMEEKLFLVGASGSVGSPTLDSRNTSDAATVNQSNLHTSQQSLLVVLRNVPSDATPIASKQLMCVVKNQQPPAKSQQVGKKRNRAKDEVEQLRQQLQSLELTLSQLQQTSSKAQRALTHPLNLWKRIADRQLEQRQKSENENARLRLMLDGQLKFARSVANMFRKRPNPMLDEKSRFQTVCSGTYALKDNTDVFKRLEYQVDRLYAEVDAVLQESGFASNKHREAQGCAAKTNDQGHVTLEMLDSVILPFDLATTGNAVWKLFTDYLVASNKGLYEALDPIRKTIRAEFSITLTLGRSEMTLYDCFFAKWIAEDHRSILLWSTEGKSDGGLLANEHLEMRRSGWTVIETIPSTDGSLSSSPSSTITQTVVRMTPTVIGASPVVSLDLVSKLSDLALSTLPHKMEVTHQMLENLILQSHMNERVTAQQTHLDENKYPQIGGPALAPLLVSKRCIAQLHETQSQIGWRSPTYQPKNAASQA